MGMVVQLPRGMLGADWAPETVQFVHAPAGNSDLPHRRMFGCPVRFSTDRNAIVLPNATLDRPVPLSDPGFRAYAGIAPHTMHPVSGQGMGNIEQAKAAILGLLPRGRCTAGAVARGLGIDRRTLHRHLGQAGLNFSAMRDLLRSALARQYLEGSALSVTEIAQLLGFTSVSAFSRWFRQSAGCSPTALRVTLSARLHAKSTDASHRENATCEAP